MGFLICPNCGKEVSDLAEITACPRDFHPFDPLIWKRKDGCERCNGPTKLVTTTKRGNKENPNRRYFSTSAAGECERRIYYEGYYDRVARGEDYEIILIETRVCLICGVEKIIRVE